MGSRRTAILAVVLAAIAIGFFVARLSRPSVSSPPRPSTRPAEKTGPSRAYPDPSRTPGATNPDITDDNIETTICNADWSTRSIRPPESYTAKLKREQMREWALPGSTADYEEDHFISLELGGDPKDPRNLWPEPYDPRPGAKEKDVVENYLHKQVCSGAMTLTEAQKAIVTDWYKVYLEIHR